MTMKTLLLTMVVTFVCGASVSAQEIDGNWWLKYSNPKAVDSDVHQMLYVQGFLAGREDGAAGVEANVVFNKKDGDPCAADVVAAYRAHVRYTDNVTVGQVRDGLNQFYKDSENRSISVARGIDVVLRSMKGENVEERILAYRRVSGSGKQ